MRNKHNIKENQEPNARKDNESVIYWSDLPEITVRDGKYCIQTVKLNHYANCYGKEGST